MKIAMVAPCWFEVPPDGYGGIEWMCHWLTEGLVARGHEVVLYSAGAARTSATHFQTIAVPPSLRLGEPMPEVLHLASVERALTKGRPDIVHDHTLIGPLLASGRDAATVVTAHGPIEGEMRDYYARLGSTANLVAISDAQRRAASELAWVGTVHNAIPVHSYPFRSEKENFALFLGRMSPEKGVHLAIDAAREAGIHLIIAAKCNEPLEYEYLACEVEPRLHPGAEWIGEADTATKKDLLSRARCLLFPVRWEEPFGIVMIESLACGTPVVALRGGSVPEVVLDGETGYVCDDPVQLSQKILECDLIDPAVCRRHTMEHFDVRKMVLGYEQVYRQVLEVGVIEPSTPSVSDDPVPANLV